MLCIPTIWAIYMSRRTNLTTRYERNGRNSGVTIGTYFPMRDRSRDVGVHSTKTFAVRAWAVFLSCSVFQSTASYQVNTSVGSTYLPGFRGRFTAIHQYGGHCPKDKILTREKDAWATIHLTLSKWLKDLCYLDVTI